MKTRLIGLLAILFSLGASLCVAQERAAEGRGEEEKSALSLPNSDRVRVSIRFMAGYGFDGSQASLGFEKQGRVGYAIVALSGRIHKRVHYLIEINPVSETQPLVACGEENYFFPNTPQPIGPNVACDNNGRMRVDDYRFVALDVLSQQGPLRQGYLVYTAGMFDAKFGRFILPLGFGWEEMGSFSAKDATHIQRINAEANFGLQLSLTHRPRAGRSLGGVSVAGIIGDGNRFHDYAYFYGLDGTLDSNSWQTIVLSGNLQPVRNLDLKASWKRGDTGSKVERLPNFFASKRNDNALVFSARYRALPGLTLFGESARYTWGLMKTSAEMLGLDQAPVEKAGYYLGADYRYRLTPAIAIGTTITREELSRDDSLVKYLAQQDAFGVQMGKHERSATVRVYADLGGIARIGFYHNNLSNPYPWISGIVPVSGPVAFQSKRGDHKWGVVLQFRVQ